MSYVEFSEGIYHALRACPDGLTWLQLKEQLQLPYAVPCYTWIRRMEAEIGLQRRHGAKGMIWSVK